MERREGEEILCSMRPMGLRLLSSKKGRRGVQEITREYEDRGEIPRRRRGKQKLNGMILSTEKGRGRREGWEGRGGEGGERTSEGEVKEEYTWT